MSCASAQTTAVPAGQAEALPQDPAVVSGELANGFRYMVRKHANPPGKATMWLHLNTGSLNETDQQQGLAHYLEHMAFNGSAHFPPGTLVHSFEARGMVFGRDQNAFTNQRETTYQLALPKVDAATLGKGMLFFADVISNLSLKQREIDAERQIILEELRRGQTPARRVADTLLKRIAPGSNYGRPIIGTEASINRLQEPDFRDYYEKWYAASNATLLVVADADPAEIVKLIGKAFGDAPKRPRPVSRPAGVTSYSNSFAIVATDAEIKGTDIGMIWIEEALPIARTVPNYRAFLIRRVAERAMDWRLRAEAAKAGGAFTSADLSLFREGPGMRRTDLWAGARDGAWRQALNGLALELQRARGIGFTAAEMEDAKKQIVAAAESNTENIGERSAETLIRELNDAATYDRGTMSPQQQLELIRRLLPGISLEELNQTFAQSFKPGAVAFVARMEAGPGAPTEEQLLAAGVEALAQRPLPEGEAADPASSLLSAPPPGGTVAATSRHAATKVSDAWLSNNVKVHHRYVGTEKNRVSVDISLIGGEMQETDANDGITALVGAAWAGTATSRLSSTEIRRLMIGKKAVVTTDSDGHSVSMAIYATSEELETGFQLAYLRLTDPRIEETAFTRLVSGWREKTGEDMLSPTRNAEEVVREASYPQSDTRGKPFTVEDVDRLTLAASQAWLEKLIRESPIEVTIVGDISRKRAMDLAAKYLGSLPARERVRPYRASDAHRLGRRKGPQTVERTIDTNTNQAFVYSGFYSVDDADRRASRAMSIAARILTTRMTKEIREDAQLVYGIDANSWPGLPYSGFGMFYASAVTDPLKTAALRDKLSAMYRSFAEKGPTADEIKIVRKQIANAREKPPYSLAYWRGALREITYRGETLNDFGRRRPPLSAEEVRRVFAKYYKPENEIIVVVKPRAPLANGGAGDVLMESSR
ncbi:MULTISPECIES: M16 family metallopeptidase [Rhodomicrobium]|uniref:M16 family metallopeptidase n=1 Tax=Rhodomicrobium TaxID=1068 RepID=UPI001482B75F|nr:MULTISPECIES: M16 family metallopeptidase [Rhodomicrobium]